MLSLDGQAKHDLKWVGCWAAMTLVFALVGYFTRSAWWIAALVTGAFLYFYGVSSFTAWRDRIAQAKREDKGDQAKREDKDDNMIRSATVGI